MTLFTPLMAGLTCLAAIAGGICVAMAARHQDARLRNGWFNLFEHAATAACLFALAALA